MSIKEAKPQAASCVGTRLLIVYAGQRLKNIIFIVIYVWCMFCIINFYSICFLFLMFSISNVDVIQSSDLC